MAYLVLENGKVFEGQRFGADGDSIGELVFTTAMVGYPETLTDPAYAGQIVIQTFPMVGNYGIIPADIAPTSFLRGYIVREHCDTPSNFRSEQTLDAFLKQRGIVGLCGIDTRELTSILRENGTMNALICDTVPEDLTPLKQYRVADAVAQVSTREMTVFPAVGKRRYAVTLWDFGVSRGLIDGLCARGCEVTVVPHDTPTGVIKQQKPDGVVLSGGPGDPREYETYLPLIRELFSTLPLLGVGLGHQLVALARGGKVEKLPYGHRGANQPVRTTDIDAQHTYITSQNHGYVVSDEPCNTLVLFHNANDGTCEGIDYLNCHCLTVQFDPNDVVYDRFLTMMGGDRNA